MKKTLRLLGLILAMVAALVLAGCGGDEGEAENRFLGSFTGDCPRGPLGFWDCNMAWDEQCWQ